MVNLFTVMLLVQSQKRKTKKKMKPEKGETKKKGETRKV